MNSIKTIVALPIVAALSACASPIAPTFVPADLGTTAITNAHVSKLPDATMPGAGTASYTGRVVAQEANEGVIGDLALTADFGASTITGTASNLNIIGSSDIDDQTLAGSLGVSGTIAGTGMTADMTGNLTGAAQGFSIGFNADLNMVGQFKTATNPADKVAGTITGSIAITAPNGGGDTLNITTGTFAACGTGVGGTGTGC